MSRNLGVISGTVVAGAAVTLLARIRGVAGQLVTVASLSSISYTVTDLTAGVQIASNQPLPAPVVIFDALIQGDPRWTRDTPSFPGPDGASGYNFATTLPASLFAQTSLARVGNNPLQSDPHRWQVDVAFMDVSGNVFRVVFAFTPVPTWQP